MSLVHRIEILNKPSYTDRKTCRVNITVIQVIPDLKELPSFSIPTLSFSFDEHDNFPRRCKDQFEEQLLRMQPLMKHATREYLVDKMVKYAVNLAYQRDQVVVSLGYVVEARLYIVHLPLDVEKGLYKGGGREEVIMCPVCLEDLTPGMEFSMLPCSHMFHTSCIDRWCETKKTCPYCRYELKYENNIKKRLTNLVGSDDIVGGMTST